ncbi:unnamed protein product [Rhizophagus irregularis]|uniref:G-protein coupled receptors family 2 profile 2 domain-containing protein n=1 Tax=Rhizophagus irregularis TaxID=588596 RepID=A0A2I1GJ93_9GLOM|nr:hypothetical protein RhiirA4_444462 [Rhizophagus irregularis]CAB4413529.1 unnamed protein product [Rhizophagus irregularis]
MRLFWCPNVLLLFCMLFGAHGQKCGRYYQNGGICVNYKSNEDYVFYAKGQNILSVESSFGSLAIAQGLSTLKDDDLILNNCVQAFSSFVCATAFPSCKRMEDSAPNLEVEIIPPCKSTCTNVIESCVTNSKNASAETQEIIKEYILSHTFFPRDCNGNITTSPPLNYEYPTEGCNSSSQLSNRPKCFKPLIEDHKWVETNKSEITSKEFCRNGCCVPCPQPYALYPPNQMKEGFMATQILRILSVIGSGIILFSYVVLPGYRTHPNILILFASLSIFLYSSNVFFSIMDPERVQCATEIIPSTQANNPFFCGLQGALLIFSSLATAIWVGFIILNLHVQTVWNSNIMDDKRVYLHIIGWGIPAILTIIALKTNSINYQFATLCFVKVEASNAIFFYPLVVIVVISRKEGKKSNTSFSGSIIRILQPIKIQWRELLLSVLLLVTVIIYWLFYHIELNSVVKVIRNIHDGDWITCIQSGKGQSFCANIVASKFMPYYTLLLVAEIFVSLTGVNLFLTLFNEILWLELNNWITETFRDKEIY